jgi:hypothetical protein
MKYTSQICSQLSFLAAAKSFLQQGTTASLHILFTSSFKIMSSFNYVLVARIQSIDRTVEQAMLPLSQNYPQSADSNQLSPCEWSSIDVLVRTGITESTSKL